MSQYFQRIAEKSKNKNLDTSLEQIKNNIEWLKTSSEENTIFQISAIYMFYSTIFEKENADDKKKSLLEVGVLIS